MSTNNENPLAAAVRAAYRSLPEKHRATLLKRACPLHPNTTYSILHAAHIPATFQPERISHWLRPDQQQKIEAVILMPEHEEWFDRLVRAFFIESQKSINEWFLASVEKGGQKQLTFDEALAEVPRHFPNDPFVNLYIAGIRWVCSDGMKSHDELVLKEREQATAAPTTGPADVPPSTTHDARPPKSNPQALLPDKLSQFDQGLQQLTDAIAALRNLQPCDCDKLITTTKATRKLADELTSELNQLAADSKHPAPAWSSRDEFCAAWTSVAAAKANQQADREKCQQFKSSVAKLLETATIKVRVPSLLPSRLAMSSSAATEIRNSLLALPDLLQGGPAEPAAWLKWLWSLEGEAADKLHTNLQSNLPELAKLTVVVDWDELQWPSAAKENSLTAPSPSPAPVPTGPPVVTTPAPLAATQPAKLLAKDQATQPSAPKAPTQPIVQPTVPSPVASDAAAPASSNAPKPATPPTKTPISQPSSRPTSTLPVASPTSAPVKQAVPVASTNTPVPQPVSLPPRVPTPAAPPQPSPAPAKPAPVAVAAVQPKAPSTQPPVQSQPDQSQSLFDTVWKLARQGRWGLASHIASLHPEASLPPAWAFEAAELGPRVNYEISPLSERLGDLFLLSGDFSIENIPSSKQPAVRLLIAGAALRPALLAPQTGAASLLKLASINATVRLSGFGALIDAAAEFGLHRQPLQPHMLRSTHNRADWEQQLVRVREDIKAWVEKAPKSHFSFAPALRIWLAWTGTNGALTSLLNRTANATVADLAELTKAWAKWSNAPADQVQSAMKAIGQWKPIDGVHRDKLIARLQEAIDLANRMLAVLSQSPQVGSDFREEKILHQLDVVRQNLKPAAAELRELSTNASEDIQAAAGLCLGTLDHLASLFTGSLPLPGAEEPKPCWLVDAELLRDTSFPLNSDGVLLPPTPTHLGRLVVLSRTVPDSPGLFLRQ